MAYIPAHRVNLETIRKVAINAAADTSNPLTIEWTATARLNARSRAALLDQALADGFHTFRGVGVSMFTRMTKGAVPTDDSAESLEIGDGIAVYRLVALTEAGRAARATE